MGSSHTSTYLYAYSPTSDRDKIKEIGLFITTVLLHSIKFKFFGLRIRRRFDLSHQQLSAGSYLFLQHHANQAMVEELSDN